MIVTGLLSLTGTLLYGPGKAQSHNEIERNPELDAYVGSLLLEVEDAKIEIKPGKSNHQVAEEKKPKPVVKKVVKPVTKRGGPSLSSGVKHWVNKPENWLNPVGYEYISPQYRGHFGLDMVAACNTPIVAPESGRVIESGYGWNGGYGNTVLIDHGDIKTRYGHLTAIFVKSGDVIKGQEIGTVGTTGRSTGCHLHYESFRI